jgi:hypothetical protein
MITRNMIIAAPNRDPFCGVVVDCMWHVLEKGQVTLSIGWSENVIANKVYAVVNMVGAASTLTSVSPKSQPKPSCRDIYMIMMVMAIQGFDDQSDEFAGTLMTTINTMAARQQGQ